MDKKEDLVKQEEKTDAVKRIQVVIPYDKSRDKAERLELSVTSLCAFAKFDFDLVIVGDSPEDYPDDVMVIPFDEGCSHDETGALMTAMNSDAVGKKFIVVSLKTCLNKPILLAHTELPKVDVHGGKPTYSLKFPTMFDKEKWFESQHSREKDVSADGCVFNYFTDLDISPMILDWTKDFLLLPVITSAPNMDAVKYYLPLKAAVYIEYDSAFEQVKQLLYDSVRKAICFNKTEKEE